MTSQVRRGPLNTAIQVENAAYALSVMDMPNRLLRNILKSGTEGIRKMKCYAYAELLRRRQSYKNRTAGRHR